MKNYLIKLSAAGASTIAMSMFVAGSAMAGSVSEQGESVGGAPGAPLPPGLYFIEEDNWGSRSTPAGKSSLGVNINALVWSTPWTIAGARLQLTGVLPNAEINSPAPNGAGTFNPFLAATLAWNLGNGYNVSYTLAGYIPMSTSVFLGDDPAGALENRLGISYLKDGWNFSGNFIFGLSNPGGGGGLVGLAQSNNYPNYFNADLTATKAIGKWTVGAIGYYSTDLADEVVATGMGKQSQFALGAIVGYDWGPLVTQVYVSHDVYQQNYGGQDTRVWGRVIVPLGDPFAASTNTSQMYHK